MNEVQIVRLHRFEGDADSKLKAFCDISIGDFIVRGFRIVDGKNGLFLSMPREQGKDGKWYETVSPSSPEVKQKLTETVLDAYKE